MKTRSASKTPSKSKWSKNVTEHSDALDLEEGVFSQTSPKKIADSLKQSAEHSDRRKSNPFRSAMSMLNFYVNRAGSKLSAAKQQRLEVAKDELRKDFGKAVEKGADRQGDAKPSAAKSATQPRGGSASKRARKPTTRRASKR